MLARATIEEISIDEPEACYMASSTTYTGPSFVARQCILAGSMTKAEDRQGGLDWTSPRILVLVRDA